MQHATINQGETEARLYSNFLPHELHPTVAANATRSKRCSPQSNCQRPTNKSRVANSADIRQEALWLHHAPARPPSSVMRQQVQQPGDHELHVRLMLTINLRLSLRPKSKRSPAELQSLHIAAIGHTVAIRDCNIYRDRNLFGSSLYPCSPIRAMGSRCQPALTVALHLNLLASLQQLSFPCLRLWPSLLQAPRRVLHLLQHLQQ